MNGRLEARQTFRDPSRSERWTRAIVIPVSILLGLLFVPDAISEEASSLAGTVALRLSNAAIALWLFFVAWRTRRIGFVYVDASGLHEYRLLRTRSWAWDEIDRVAAEVRNVPMKAILVRVLVVYQKDGRSKLANYSTAAVKLGESSWVDLAAEKINERLVNARRES